MLAEGGAGAEPRPPSAPFDANSEDPTLQGRYLELYREIQTFHLANGTGSTGDYPAPFRKTKLEWKPFAIALLLVLFIIFVVVFDSLYVGDNLHAREFVNVFCTLILLGLGAALVLHTFPLRTKLALVMVLATSLIRLGSMVLLLAVQFFQNAQLYWPINFAGMCTITLGGLLFAAGSVVDGTAENMVGGLVFSLGLAFITVGLLFVGIDTQVSSGLQVTGSVITMLGCIIIASRFVRDLQRPLLKPLNYLAMGISLYGAGAFTMIWPAGNGLEAKFSSYAVNINTNVLGATLFVLGSDLLRLSTYRRLILMDNMLEDRYASTTRVTCNALSALVNYATVGWMACPGAVVVLVGVVFFDSTARAYIAFGGFLLLLVAFAGLGMGFALTTPHSTLSFALIAMALGFFLQAFSLFVQVEKGTTGGESGWIVSLTSACVILVGSWLAAAKCFIEFREPLPALRSPNPLASTYWLLFHPGNYLNSVFGVLIPLFALFWLLGDLVEFGAITTLPTSNPFYQLAAYFLLHGNVVLLLHLRMALSSVKSISADFEQTSKYLLAENCRNLPPVNDPMSKQEEEEEHVDAEVNVFISGAGPSGLVLANELGIRNINTMVVEQRADCILDARFLFLNSATCEGLHSTGVLDKMLDLVQTRGLNEDYPLGAMWLTGLLQDDARCVAATTLPGRVQLTKAAQESNLDYACSRCVSSSKASQFPIRMMQSQQEQVLRECALQYPSNHIRYGTALVSFRKTSTQHYICTTQNSATGQLQRIRTKYLVACEGPNGIVSNTLGVLFDGFANVAKSKSTLFYAPGLWEKLSRRYGMCHQMQITRNGSFAVLVCVDPVRGLWNIPVRFPPGKPDTTEAEDLARLQDLIGSAQQHVEILSNSVWNLNYFIAKSYQFDTNILLCGDAGKSWPPAGGLGGNTCFGDAHNLGWKLAAMVQGWGGPALLESYSIERHQHALRTALFVKSILPKPARVITVGNLLERFPWTAPLWRLKFYFSNDGVHNNNHFAQEGICLGVRYALSPVVMVDVHCPISPDDPACHYQPRVSNGARLPLFLCNGKAIYELIARSGFTLLQFSPNDAAVVDALCNKLPFVTVVKVYEQDRDGDGGVQEVSPHSEYSSRDLYFGVSLVLVRPDRIVSWYKLELDLLPNGGQSMVEELVQVVTGHRTQHQFAARASFDLWLRGEFHNQMRGLEGTFSRAVRIENETKQEAIAKVKALTQDTIGLTTKSTNVKV
ncbi:hypothetical protein BASA81_003024 [Batrachochytrium salamandrivorans]|nr:hypothetical protein BASA81_003024 [Batrachochytrium salamandrivorans]